ncbi:hypothetical protein M422DRAFT_242595 [Sphaerobolus stellatus SS14]|nr:hypothetical protein M422DRAFT_242595 [Sphaerobolus stellatus SS14]
MNALREEIKETISATIKEKLCSDADSITTVSHSMTALDANAQYWSNLSNKATRCSCRALELQLKIVRGPPHFPLIFLDQVWQPTLMMDTTLDHIQT